MSFGSYGVKDAGKVQELEPTKRIKTLQELADKKGLVYKISADDKYEMLFDDLIRQGKSKLERYVPWIFRLKINKQFSIDQSTDEVIVWYEQRKIYQHDGEPLELNQREGVLLEPIERKRMQNGKMVVTGTQGSKPIYYEPFTPERVDEIIASSQTGVDKFHLATGTTRGPDVVSGVHRTIHNLEDFKTGTYDQLWDMSAFNYSTKEPRLAMWKEEGDQIKKQALTFSAMSTNVR